MKILRVVFVILAVAMPAAAQEFQSVRPTIVVPSAGALRDPVVGGSPLGMVPSPPWVFVRPTVPPLVLPPLRLPPLVLFQTPRGLAGYVIEGSIALPIGPVTAPPLALGPGWALR